MAASCKSLLSAWRAYGIHANSIEFVRNYGKHYDPKFRALRRKKFEAVRHNINLPEEEKEIFIKKSAGLTPSSYKPNIPYFISSTYEVFDPYEPKSGDGQYSSLIKKASDSVKSYTSSFSKNLFHSQKIKKYDLDFNMKDFAHEAKEIYINAHEALASKNTDELLKYSTEKAFNLMTKNFQNKTIKWKYIESLDPPTVVHVRTATLSTKDNTFAQVTVRLHSKQMLAIYDRFGRLMYGSEILAKDVLEYVIFEKHLANVYGSWKVHDKIIPDWVPPRDPVAKTYVQVTEKTGEEILDEEFRLRSEILSESDDEMKNT